MCENIGDILSDRVKERTLSHDGRSLNDLQRKVTEVLTEMKFDSQHFCIVKICILERLGIKFYFYKDLLWPNRRQNADHVFSYIKTSLNHILCSSMKVEKEKH